MEISLIFVTSVLNNLTILLFINTKLIILFDIKKYKIKYNTYIYNVRITHISTSFANQAHFLVSRNNETIWQPSSTKLQPATARSTFRFCFIIHLLGRFQRTPLKSFSSINRTSGSDTSNIARHLCPIPLRISTFAHHEIFLLQALLSFKVTNIPVWVWQPTVLLPPRKIVQINNNNIVHGTPWSNLAPPK